MTTNLDALLLENEALHHQVRQLREELALLQRSRSADQGGQAQAAAGWAGRSQPRQGASPWRDGQEPSRSSPTQEPRWPPRASSGERVRSWRAGPEVTTGAAPGITPQLVRQWAEALSGHPRWRELRLGSRLEGDPAAADRGGGGPELGLKALLDDLRARSHHPALELEEALDRRSPGLGAELRWALAGPASRAKAAVRAAFALHGPRAADRLSDDPQAVVEELLAAIAQLEARVRQEDAERRARAERQRAWGQQDGRRPGGRSWGAAPSQAAPDRQRAEALAILELSSGASRAAVKAAHRRLVKLHHPDMGGDAEVFRRINAAYQLLIA